MTIPRCYEKKILLPWNLTMAHMRNWDMNGYDIVEYSFLWINWFPYPSANLSTRQAYRRPDVVGSSSC